LTWSFSFFFFFFLRLNNVITEILTGSKHFPQYYKKTDSEKNGEKKNPWCNSIYEVQIGINSCCSLKIYPSCTIPNSMGNNLVGLGSCRHIQIPWNSTLHTQLSSG
jgi:hypothetical protein